MPNVRKNQGGEWVGWIFFIADAEDAWIFFYSPKLGLFIADHIGCLILSVRLAPKSVERKPF